ncbi:MAG: Lysine biosynthesis enzyme (LysX) [Promethearchaeota archaeon]|jgi:[lysine-biosynthesis-protein LysW]--L-2-aminoadipate ligase|nr:MAG: Lysine biosynthesis enzyme (LysX) [Candidatus Lokiarchaeota archaeon]
MKVGILHNRVTWEIKRLIEELEKSNIAFEIINNQNIYFRLSKEKDLEFQFDLILERSLSYFRGLYSCAILETKGYKVLNNFECLNITGNKLLTSLKLIENNIPTPNTYFAFKEDASMQAIDEGLHYPAIIKPIIGSWGRLIAKLEDQNSARSNLECRETMGNILQKQYYLQEYLSSTDPKSPTDIRVFVVGDDCVAAMGRYNPEEDFRSNIALGGTAKKEEITDEIRKISLNASKAVNGEIVGVDLMVKNGKFYVIEVNGTPQFRAVSKASKINVANKIVDYIIRNYKK